MKQYFALLFLGVAIVAFFEWRTDEDTLTMLALLVSSLALGAYRPRQFIVSGIILGSSITLISLFSLLTGLHPIYDAGSQGHSRGFFDAATMLVLIVPALAASFLGRLISGKVGKGRGDD